MAFSIRIHPCQCFFRRGSKQIKQKTLSAFIRVHPRQKSFFRPPNHHPAPTALAANRPHPSTRRCFSTHSAHENRRARSSKRPCAPRLPSTGENKLSACSWFSGSGDRKSVV